MCRLIASLQKVSSEIRNTLIHQPSKDVRDAVEQLKIVDLVQPLLTTHRFFHFQSFVHQAKTVDNVTLVMPKSDLHVQPIQFI